MHWPSGLSFAASSFMLRLALLQELQMAPQTSPLVNCFCAPGRLPGGSLTGVDMTGGGEGRAE